MLQLDRPGIPGHGRMAARAARPRPSAPSRPASPGGARPASSPRRLGRAMPRPGPARPRAAWTRPSEPTSRRWRAAGQPGRPAAAGRRARVCGPGRGRLPAERARPRAASTSPRASRCAVSSPTPPPLAAGLVTLAWIRQAGGDRPGPWRRSARPSGLAPGPAAACSTRSRRSGPGCCWPRATWPARPAGRTRRGLGAGDEPDYPPKPGHLVLARVLLAQDRPGRGACAAGPAARGGGRAGPDRQPHRDPARCGRWRWPPAARRRRGGRPGRRAHPGLPAGLRPGLRRRGPADGRAAGPADRGPAGGQAGPRRIPLGCLARLQRAFGAGPPRRRPGGAAPRRRRAWSSR